MWLGFGKIAVFDLTVPPRHFMAAACHDSAVDSHASVDYIIAVALGPGHRGFLELDVVNAFDSFGRGRGCERSVFNPFLKRETWNVGFLCELHGRFDSRAAGGVCGSRQNARLCGINVMAETV